MSFITAKDKSDLYYNDIGSGEPVVLIHGWPLNSEMWEYQQPALLSRGFRVISYDRRGFGKSSQPSTGYDYETLAEDLKEILDQLKLEKVRLVGFSMGGGEIARYLSRFGAGKISQAVLISTVLPFMLQGESNPKGVPAKIFEDMKSALKEDRPQFLTGFNKDFYGVGMLNHPVSEGIMHWTTAMAFAASPIATMECVTAFGATDFRPDMKAFTVPTLILHGTADKIVPIDPTGEESSRLIPGAIFKRYQGAPHGLFVTHKNQLNEDLMSFLK